VGTSPNFGMSVALSADGNTALIGGPGDNQTGGLLRGMGAAWIFTRSGSTWSQSAKLVPSDAASNVWGTQAGAAVSLSANGTIACVGGLGEGNYANGTDPGAAWIFLLSNGVWAQVGSKIQPNDEDSTEAGGSFGAAVALSGDGTTAMMGAPNDAENTGA